MRRLIRTGASRTPEAAHQKHAEEEKHNPGLANPEPIRPLGRSGLCVRLDSREGLQQRRCRRNVCCEGMLVGGNDIRGGQQRVERFLIMEGVSQIPLPWLAMRIQSNACSILMRLGGF